MKRYLNLVMLAMMLIALAGVDAADSVGGQIGNYQEAQQEAQRILDPVEFFELGYPAAFDNAGSLLLNDPKCRQHCIREAVKLFQKGAALGDPDAMMSLADQISKNQASGDPSSLYQRAAKLGHPGARLALETLAGERTLPRLIFRFPF